MGFNERIAEICGHMKSRKAPIPHGFQNIKESDFRNDTCKQNAEAALDVLEKVVRIGVNKGFDNDAVKKAVKGLTNGIMEFANERKMRKDSEIMKVRNNVNAVIADFNAAKISRNENSAMINQVNTWLDQTIVGIESAKKFDIIKNDRQVEILESYSKRLSNVKETISHVVDQNSENAFAYFKKIIDSIKSIRGSVGAKNLNPIVDETYLSTLEETATNWRDDRRQSKPSKESIDGYKYNPIDTKDPMNYLCHAELAYNAIDSFECEVNDYKDTMASSKKNVEDYNKLKSEKERLDSELKKIQVDVQADRINNGLTQEQAVAKYGALLKETKRKSAELDAQLKSPITLLTYKMATTELETKGKTAAILSNIVASIKAQQTNPYVYVSVGEIIYQNREKINKFITPGASAEEMKQGAAELTMIQGYINDTIKDSIIQSNKMIEEVSKANAEVLKEIEAGLSDIEKSTAGLYDGLDLGTEEESEEDMIAAIYGSDEVTNKPEENKQEDNSIDGLMNEELNSIL